MPSFFQDFNGAFSLASSFDGRRSLVMEHTARFFPILWVDASAKVKFPLSIFGDSQAWQDVSVHADVALVANPIVDAFAHTATRVGTAHGHGGPGARRTRVSNTFPKLQHLTRL